MWLSRFRFYMAIFALLAFTSQSFAVVKLPCEQMAQHSTAPAMVATTDMAHMGHMGHMVHAEAENAVASGCCSQDDCSQMGCISASVAASSSIRVQHYRYAQGTGDWWASRPI